MKRNTLFLSSIYLKEKLVILIYKKQKINLDSKEESTLGIERRQQKIRETIEQDIVKEERSILNTT